MLQQKVFDKSQSAGPSCAELGLPRLFPAVGTKVVVLGFADRTIFCIAFLRLLIADPIVRLIATAVVDVDPPSSPIKASLGWLAAVGAADALPAYLARIWMSSAASANNPRREPIRSGQRSFSRMKISSALIP